MYVIAGFESRIAAHGGALAVADVARERGLKVGGAAFARWDAERAIHVDPVPGFGMPEHVLQVLDGVFLDGPGPAHLNLGETGLVLELGDAPVLEVDPLVTSGHLQGRGALWVTTATNGAGLETLLVERESETEPGEGGSG